MEMKVNTKREKLNKFEFSLVTFTEFSKFSESRQNPKVVWILEILHI